MIGEAMRLIRIINGIKANIMATKLEISPSYLSLIENGKKQPSIDIVEKFASLIGVRPSQIMYFSEELSIESGNQEKNGMITKLTRPIMFKWLKAMASRCEDEE